MRPRPAKLCEPAMNGLAHQSAFDAISGIDQDPVAGRPAFDTRADFSDLSRTIESHDRRQRNLDPWHSAAREDVVVVEGGSADPNEHIAFAGSRVREVGFQYGRSRTTLLPQYHRSHRVSLAVLSAASFISAFVSILLVPASGSSFRNQTQRGC